MCGLDDCSVNDWSAVSQRRDRLRLPGWHEAALAQEQVAAAERLNGAPRKKEEKEGPQKERGHVGFEWWRADTYRQDLSRKLGVRCARCLGQGGPGRRVGAVVTNGNCF